jgi:long-chain fatty acid transport protein
MRYAPRRLAGCLFWLLFLGALVSSPAATRAQGIFLTGVGPVNQGMGGAAVAAPLDSAGALAWNPATISGLSKSEMTVALGLVLPSTTISSQAFGLAGSTDGEPGVTPIPTMSFVLKDACSPWTWGVGVFGIGGFSTNFPGSSLANPATANPILTPQPPAGIGVGRVFSHAEIYQVTPTVSYALTEKLSVGFAANIDLADIQADPLLFAPPNFALGSFTYGPGTGTRFAWGAGFQVGAYYITDYNWRFGVSYKSTQWFEPLRFNSNDQLGNPVLDKVNFDLPSITSIGAAYSGFERLLYAVDVRFFDYAKASGFNGTGFRADGSVAGLGWRNVVSVSNGVQYNLTDCWDVRGGYTFVGNPVPASQEQFNLGTSLIMQHFLSVGASYRIRQNIAANIAYTHGFQASLTGPYVTPAGPIPGTSITSTTSADLLIVGLSLQF